MSNINNRIYLNYFLDNDDQVYCSVEGNFWNSTARQNYQYRGVTYNNYTGNYWLDYEGLDKNSDGIGDKPMGINMWGVEVADYYPMMLDLPRPPKAIFTTDVTTNYAPLSVQFTDISPFEPTGWQWDFGDGSTSAEQNPVHVYSTPGVYTVNLTATNTYGQQHCESMETAISAHSSLFRDGFMVTLD